MFLWGQLAVICGARVAKNIAADGVALILALNDLSQSEAVKRVSWFDDSEVGFCAG